MRRVLLSLGIGLLSLVALGAAPLDERGVIDRVAAGKFSELRGLKEQSDRGVPYARYWWGALIGDCVYGACDEDGRWDLWERAAVAGYPFARQGMIQAADSPGDMRTVLAQLGKLSTVDDRFVLASWLSTRNLVDAGKLFHELVAEAPELRTYAMLAFVEGPVRHREVLRAMVEAGFSPVSERFVSGEIIARNKRDQFLERAKAGDRAVAIALCDTAFVTTGEDVPPGEVLAICEREAARGMPGMLPVLLRHHVAKGNLDAAAFYARLCEARYPLRCAEELADFYRKKAGGESKESKLWGYVYAKSAPHRPGFDQPPSPEFAPRYLSIRTKAYQDDQGCVRRRYDPVSKSFAPRPDCAWGKSIAIPREFRSAAE